MQRWRNLRIREELCGSEGSGKQRRDDDKAAQPQERCQWGRKSTRLSPAYPGLFKGIFFLNILSLIRLVPPPPVSFGRGNREISACVRDWRMGKKLIVLFPSEQEEKTPGRWWPWQVTGRLLPGASARLRGVDTWDEMGLLGRRMIPPATKPHPSPQRECPGTPLPPPPTAPAGSPEYTLRLHPMPRVSGNPPGREGGWEPLNLLPGRCDSGSPD